MPTRRTVGTSSASERLEHEEGHYNSDSDFDHHVRKLTARCGTLLWFRRITQISSTSSNNADSTPAQVRLIVPKTPVKEGSELPRNRAT